MFKTKRADISITVLVFMTLAVCGAALFIFLTRSGQINQTIMELGSFDSLYAEEETYIFSVQSLAEQISNTESLDSEQEFRHIYARAATADNELLSKYTESIRVSLDNPESRIYVENGVLKFHVKKVRFYQEEPLVITHYKDIDFEIPLKTSTS